MSQSIFIHGLRLCCHVGVPDEELAVAQELLLHLEMMPSYAWDQLQDDIALTVDYAKVVEQLEQLAGAKPRRLIETLAVDIVDFLLESHPLTKVKVTIEKFILPQTRSVAVMLEKSR
jgi:FolB domain-containing protein